MIGDLDDLKDDVERETHDAVDDTMETVVELAKNYLRGEGSVVTRVLLNSIEPDTSAQRGGTLYEARSTMPYAKYVEFGTGMQFGTSQWAVPTSVRPYSAPTMSTTLVDEIYDWVLFKNIVPHNAMYTQRDIAYFIADSISEYGTEPHPFMRPAWFMQERQLQQKLDAAVTRALR